MPVRKATRVPEFLPFQHPKLVQAPPRGGGWRHEIKLDGYRMQLRIAGGRVAWRTREAHDWSSRFPDLSAIVDELGDAILDGELCVLGDDGQPDFTALRRAVGWRQAGRIEGDLVYFLFDLLWAGREDLRPLPLETRLQRLEAFAAPVLGHEFRIPQPLPGTGPALLDAACRLQLEGIISKRLDAPYEGGERRRDSWRKSKCRPSGEVLIGGWRTQEGRFRSLLGGVMEDGKLRYVGRIHTGFSAAKLGELLPQLQARKIDRSPFQLGDVPRLTGVHWVRPELVARVTYAEVTPSQKLRQAAYHGLRADKAPEHVALETPAPAPATRETARAAKPKRSAPAPLPAIDKPDKVLWPATDGAAGVTKARLAEYYEAVARWMLPYVEGRPCTLVIAPDGIEGEITWVRHEGHWRGALRTSPLITHWKVPEKQKTYPGFDTVEALVQAADLGVVEIHPWNSAPGRPMRPARLVFDLDPEEDQDARAIAEAAVELKERLEALGLTGFLKTSGRRGLHVVTPLAGLDGDISWDRARAFAKQLCEHMAGDSPERYTTALPKAQRRGRVFLDYLRNDPGHHAVGLLSPRTTPRATVSMPIGWPELRRGARVETIWTAAARLRRRDPWSGYADAAAPLPPRSSLQNQARTPATKRVSRTSSPAARAKSAVSPTLRS